jgi:CheY-like chemotaxis protein
MARSVLYVDDEAPLRELVQTYLSIEGWNVTTAGEGNEAIDLLSRQEFDVLLLDLHMPNTDGLEVLRFMREQNIQTPTIIMSGDERPFLKELCSRYGANDHLSKPFDFDDLLLALNRAQIP